MKQTHRGNPRLEPQRWHLYFCSLMRCQPGELKLSREKDFAALVGQFFIDPKRKEYFAKSTSVFRAWHAGIENQREQRTYVKRGRRSISDNLRPVLGLLYWNHAAWIILRGEYKAMKKTLQDREIEKRLKERYGYLSQLERYGWFGEVKGRPPIDEMKRASPSDLACRDTAESLELDEDSLRLMLSPGRLRESPPASLIRVNMDSKKLLSRLQRIPLSRRTAKDRALIRAIESEFYPLY